MRSLDYARDDNLKGSALKKSLSFRTVFREESHRVKLRSTKRLLVTLGEKTLRQLNQKTPSSPCNRMRSLDCARDDNLRDGALKKLLSFRTVFREESHPVKQRSTKRLLVTLGEKTLRQLNRKTPSSRCNRMRSLDYARDDNFRDGALKNHCHSERQFVRNLIP